jgi:hypothetical protein
MKKYEIWVGKIQKVTLEELAQMIIENKLEAAHYAETSNLKILLAFLVENERKILDDGRFIVRKGVTDVVFTEVEEYKLWINYNHVTNKAEYTHYPPQMSGYYVKSIPVFRSQCGVVKEVVKAILKRKNKGVSK